jgi:hypothetical protein
VVRSPEQLSLHPALGNLGWTCQVDELNAVSRGKGLSVAEPILTAGGGVILSGFGLWRFAILKGRREIDCIEYPLDEHQSLQFIVTLHRPHRFFNAFIRISLALTMEPYSRRKALESFRVRYCSSHHAAVPKGPPSICAEVSRETAVKKGAD